jgi:hypothetical protein
LVFYLMDQKHVDQSSDKNGWLKYKYSSIILWKTLTKDLDTKVYINTK